MPSVSGPHPGRYEAVLGSGPGFDQMPRLIAGTRSPFGRFGGRLRDVEPLELGATVLRHSLNRADAVIRSELAPEAVIAAMGCFEAGAFVPARQIAVNAGIAVTTPSLTIDRACCSGLTAIGIAAKEVRSGDKHSVAVVGLESMSRTPYFLPGLRWGVKRGDVVLNDPLAFRSPLAANAPIARYTGELSLEWVMTALRRMSGPSRVTCVTGLL